MARGDRRDENRDRSAVGVAGDDLGATISSAQTMTLRAARTASSMTP